MSTSRRCAPNSSTSATPGMRSSGFLTLASSKIISVSKVELRRELAADDGFVIGAPAAHVDPLHVCGQFRADTVELLANIGENHVDVLAPLETDADVGSLVSRSRLQSLNIRKRTESFFNRFRDRFQHLPRRRVRIGYKNIDKREAYVRRKDYGDALIDTAPSTMNDANTIRIVTGWSMENCARRRPNRFLLRAVFLFHQSPAGSGVAPCG